MAKSKAHASIPPVGPELQEKPTEKATAGSIFNLSAGTNTVVKTWRHGPSSSHQGCIQIVVEQPGDPMTELVTCDYVDLKMLFSFAPSLLREVYDQRIVLEASAALDEDIVNDVVNTMSDCAKAGKPFEMKMHRDPIRYIKVHCVLMRFGMHKEAGKLLEELWNLMSYKELSLGDVLWIWENFGDPIGNRRERGEYVTPAADEYVQMMAWQLVNMDAIGDLNDEVRKFIMMEGEPRFFFDMLKERKDKSGLGRDLLKKTGETTPAHNLRHSLTDLETAAKVTTTVLTCTNALPELSAEKKQSSTPEKATHSNAGAPYGKTLMPSSNNVFQSLYDTPSSKLDTIIQTALEFTSPEATILIEPASVKASAETSDPVKTIWRTPSWGFDGANDEYEGCATSPTGSDGEESIIEYSEPEQDASPPRFRFDLGPRQPASPFDFSVRNAIGQSPISSLPTSFQSGGGAVSTPGLPPASAPPTGLLFGGGAFGTFGQASPSTPPNACQFGGGAFGTPPMSAAGSSGGGMIRRMAVPKSRKGGDKKS